MTGRLRAWTARCAPKLMPERRRITERLSWVATWAMAVGGMIGGGIYTLAGFILGVAGPLAWLSLALGALVALATVVSYTELTAAARKDGTPVPTLLRKGQVRLASVLAWWLLLVYVLSTAVYTFTFGQYVGRALGLSQGAIVAVEFAIVAALAGVNLLGMKEHSAVQIAAVWISLLVVGAVGIGGLVLWNPQNLREGIPPASLSGVVYGAAGAFIAFEGFEMLAYATREVRDPRVTLPSALLSAVVAVSIAYAVVTIGAGSLVGAKLLVAQKENALAVAGSAIAGRTGFAIVTVAACASAASAINATLFSVARLARTSSEEGLLPAVFARVNRRECPWVPLLILGASAAAVAAVSSLDALVQVASLAFLLLFSFVNTTAFRELKTKRWISGAGALGAGLAAIVVGHQLSRSHPASLAGLGALVVAGFAGHLIAGVRRRRGRSEPGRRQRQPVIVAPRRGT